MLMFVIEYGENGLKTRFQKCHSLFVRYFYRFRISSALLCVMMHLAVTADHSSNKQRQLNKYLVITTRLTSTLYTVHTHTHLNSNTMNEKADEVDGETVEFISILFFSSFGCSESAFVHAAPFFRSSPANRMPSLCCRFAFIW